LLILGIVLTSPDSVQAAKKSGRAYQLFFGHANGDDLDTMLHIEKGDTRYGIIIPQYRYLRGVDGYSMVLLFTEDEFVDKYNKSFVKERKGYQLEAVTADKTIVEIKNLKRGGYTAKGMKEGQTVIRFYETYLGVRRYLGCRLANVGVGDTTEETVTVFVRSRIQIPSTWYSVENYSDGFDKNDLKPIPSDKSLFKKVKVSKDYYYYQAVKTGETTATITIRNVKKTFRVKIVEPSISKTAKKEYNIYEGYSLYLEENFNLFTSDIEDTQIEGISSHPDIVEIKNAKYGLGFITKKPGTAKIKLYYKVNKESKDLGEFTIHVLQNNDPEYINRLANQPSNDMDVNTGSSDDIKDQKKPSLAVNEKEKDYIFISEKSVQMKVGESVQCYSETNNESELKWKVSNTAIASINSSTGMLKAIKPGTVTVTAYTSKEEETFQLTVVAKDSIIITGETRISGEDQLEYTADRSGVVWSVSDSNMAMMEEVDGKLILYPIGTGTFILYADTDSSHGELTITNEAITFDEE
jgi:hypothetical protein